MLSFSDPKKYFKSFQDEYLFDSPQGAEYYQATLDFLQSLRNKKNFLVFVQKLHTNKKGVYKGDAYNIIWKPTASEEARNELCPAYNLMLMELAKAMGDEDIKYRWLDAYLDGFGQFVQHLVEKGPRHFLKLSQDDTNFKGCKGGIFWDSITRYINSTGEKGMNKFLDQLTKLPSEVKLTDLVRDKMLQL